MNSVQRLGLVLLLMSSLAFLESNLSGANTTLRFLFWAAMIVAATVFTMSKSDKEKIEEKENFKKK